MLRIGFVIFVILHGLVHLLYLGQSSNYFELQPGLQWPSGSWAFRGLLGDGLTRNVASGALALAAISFIVGGAALLLRQGWWQVVVVGATVFSSLIFLLMWNGRLQRLDDNGGVGLLLNGALLLIILVLGWPNVDG